jgi:hypothetical protein
MPNNEFSDMDYQFAITARAQGVKEVIGGSIMALKFTLAEP